MTTIRSVEALRSHYADPSARAVGKQLDHIDRHMRRFIALSPFVVLSTSSAEDALDASPRGGRPGFVTVADEKTLWVPDWPGNNRLDSLTNLIERDGIALLFMIPGIDETLRVNGRASLRTDSPARDACAEQERRPKLVIAVQVDAAFLHCAKALMRSRLWSAEAQVTRDALPPLGEILRDQLGASKSEGASGAAESVESQEAMVARYRRGLY